MEQGLGQATFEEDRQHMRPKRCCFYRVVRSEDFGQPSHGFSGPSFVELVCKKYVLFGQDPCLDMILVSPVFVGSYEL